MKCCCSSPNLKPPCHHLPRQAITHHLHPITIPSFPNPPSPNLSLAAAAWRTVSCSTKALCYRTTTTTRSPPTTPSAPEEEPREVFPSASTSSTSSGGYSRRVALAAATLGIAAAAFMVGADGKEALALGPEGPLVEEFWDNMRRYGIYILTVSTGAIYTILQPIAELLKNPISAILLLLILVGSFYLLSQVLSFMVGINEFSYDYAN